jgi:hypothetical protein
MMMMMMMTTTMTMTALAHVFGLALLASPPPAIASQAGEAENPALDARGDVRGDRPRVAQRDADAADVANKRARLRKRIRTMRAWKLSEALELDEATAARLFPILNRHDDKLAALAAENRKLRRQIREALASGAGDEQLEALTDAMIAKQQALWTAQRERFAAVRKVLNAKQAARIFIVLPQIDRAIQRQLQRARRGRGARAGEPPGSRKPRRAPRRSRHRGARPGR